MDVQDRVVIVTGASSGIGAATAHLLSAHGARVVLAARRNDRLQQLEAELPGSLAIVTDVTGEADIRRLIDATEERFQRIDVLVNNAGQGLHVPVEQIRLNDYRAIMELNVYAPLRLMQEVAPTMRRQGEGCIVNVSSGTTRMVLPGVAAYASTKSALNMLSQVAREELAGDGITVSLIYPYITETEFHRSLRAGIGGPAGAPRQLPPGHTAEFVAEYILRMIRTGETEIALRPDTPPAGR